MAGRERLLQTADVSQRGAPSFADVVELVNPGVVQVVTLDREERPPTSGAEQTPVPRWRGEGAGFIVDRAGLVLTNAHLVGRASRILVRLADGREWSAALVGSDASTDLALLRVAAGQLPAVRLGDSDRLRVGDWVCAIGNPYRFDHSVTVGVVSSKGRKIFDHSFDAYIQTDAAINPGNSGGPLINAAGEAVGVNAAVSREGQGIGFAIPINLAREVLVQLVAQGRVSRGYLGIQLEELQPDLAALLGAPSARGAVVLDVLPGGAGAEAGLKTYDVIRAVSGRSVADTSALIRSVSGALPGTEVTLEVLRDGRPMSIRATLGEREPIKKGEGAEGPPHRPRRPEADVLGLVVAEPAPEELRDVPQTRQGVVVRGVWSLSAGAEGLERGDLIVEVNRRPTRDLRSYRGVVDGLAAGSRAWLYVYNPSTRSPSLVRLEAEIAGQR